MKSRKRIYDALLSEHLAKDVRVSVDTIRRWVPKWYLRDWAVVKDVGDKAETFIEADYVDADCFAETDRPRVVPARTFLSQLL